MPGFYKSAQSLDTLSCKDVEGVLIDPRVGPLATGEPRRVPAPAARPLVFERDVRVAQPLGLDQQAGVVDEPHDEVGVVVAQRAVLGDVLQREAAEDRQLGEGGDVVRAIEEQREAPLEVVVDRRSG